MVLIETYWNVKTDVTESFSKMSEVLIETYWNVKESLNISNGLFGGGLNRNILECKGNS